MNAREDLDAVVGEIVQACEEKSPFFFLVGAGISCPSVPLAKSIEDECRVVARKFGREATLAQDDTALQRYSQSFKVAYPQPSQRQKYLRKLIEGRAITHANLRLAHILSAKKIANLVVTPNFDDLLSRALTLFGVPHRICDHPQTVERIDPGQDEVQLIHVHGTYWFYDCCNLMGEIEERASLSPETSFTVASLLDRILSTHSPLVIGYSGWEGDVIMKALRRRLNQHRLPNNLYWFCYRREDLNGIPDFVKNHADVHFIVPKASPERAMPGREKTEATKQETAVSFARIPPPSSGPIGLEPVSEILPAQLVLDKLIQGLHLETPNLARDPLGFFAGNLKNSLPRDEDPKLRDIYFIGSIIEQINQAKFCLAQSVQANDTALQQVLDAVRRSQYEEAIRSAAKINLRSLKSNQLRRLLESVLAALARPQSSPEEMLEGNNIVISLASMLLESEAKETAATAHLARALFNKGFALGTLNKHEEAIVAYDDLVRRFGGSSESVMMEQVGWALFNKGLALVSLNRNEEAIAACEEVVRRSAGAADPALSEQAAWALFYKGFALGAMNRNEEAIAAYDDLIRRFADAAEPALQEKVAWSLNNKGYALGELSRTDEAMAVYDDVVKRFGDSSEPALREQVAWALYTKGFALGAIDRFADAIAVYDEVIRRFVDAPEPAVMEQAAWALVNKGYSLSELNRQEEAIAVYDDLVRRFDTIAGPALMEQVATALVNKVAALRALDRNDEANQLYDDVLKRFGGSQEPGVREILKSAQEKLKPAAPKKPRSKRKSTRPTKMKRKKK